jgi:tetratricopeptide (TPR) repeat protein
MKRKIEDSIHNNQTASLQPDYLSLAEQFYKDGNIYDARISIEQALITEPDNARAISLYADFLLQLNNRNEALTQIERALDIEPDNPVLLNSYAHILCALGEFDEARIQLKHALTIGPNTVCRIRFYITILVKLNRLDEALATLEKILARAPDNAIFLQLYARTLLQLNRPDEALNAIQHALEIVPDNICYLQQHARILLILKKPNEALIPIKHALEIKSNNDVSIQIYAQALCKLNRPDEAQAAIEKALEITTNNDSHSHIYTKILYKLNRFNEAQSAIEKALEITTNNDSYFHIYAKILYKLNGFNEAQSAIEKALEITTNNDSYFRIYAKILYKLNRFNEAQSAIEKALEITTNNDSNFRVYAKILYKLNRFNEAQSAIEKALEIATNKSNLYWHAKILYQLNRPDEAQIAIEKALDIAPNVPVYLDVYAQTLLLLNKFNDALITINKSLNITPNNNITLAIKAKILFKSNKLDEARDTIEKSLEITPDNHFGLQIHAEILLRLNKLDEARNAIEKSLKITPDNHFSLQIHVEILLRLNKLDEAQVAINKALEIMPDNTSILNIAAQIFLELNNYSEADHTITCALEIAPNNVSNLQTYAKILLQLNKPEEALIQIKRAIDIAPDNTSILNIYAQILLELDSYDEAYETISRALDIEPDNATHWYVTAKFFVKANQLNDALTAIKIALDIAPVDGSNLQTYADILLQLNKHEEALIQIERALGLAPDNTVSLNTQAQILLQLNKLNEARVVIKKSLNLAPNNTTSIIYAQILSRSNKLNEAQTTIEQVLSITPDDNFALRVGIEILNKIQAEQTRSECIKNTFISKKYFNTALPSIQKSSNKEQRTNRNHLLIKLCSFQQIKDVEQGSSLDEFNPIALKINQSEFTYYTKAPTLPSNNTPCIFIMAGRQSNAAIPTGLPAPNRIILVITEEELKRVYLAHENDIAPAILLPEGTDLLVINRLESPAYGRYEQTSFINARRVAALCVAFNLELNYSMLMDDNIEELQCNNGTLTNFNQLWQMHQPNQLISSIVTSSNRSFNNTEDKKRLGSKLFLMNAVQLQHAFNFIKPEELAFFLFLPPHCSNLVMEDYYFQLLINHGLYLNNSLIQGHVALDEQTISLTRSSAHKSAAKKSANAFGVFAWLSLSKRTFVTDSLAEKLSANINSKALISPLINDVVSDIKKIVTNNLQNTNEYLSECKTVTLNKVNAGRKKNNNSLNKNQLWELIKKCPDLNLRPPQINAIELWINEKSSSYLHSYSIATGVGKTYIKAIMAYLELACTDQPVIVVTADQKLVNNLTEKFTSLFRKLNTLTQLNLSSDMIIPVMSGGNRAINQGALAVSDGFKITQNLYVFCEDSFLKLVQDRKIDVNYTSLILLDEYHCYTKTLDAAIKAVQGFLVYAGHMDEGSSCYCIDVHQDCISLFDAQGTKYLLDLKPSLIFDLNQKEFIREMVETNKNPIQLSELTLLNTLQATLKLEQQKRPFPTFHQNNTTEIPFYWGHELPTTTIKIVSNLPTEIPNERTTYITPTGIYQTNQAGITQCVITQDEL